MAEPVSNKALQIDSKTDFIAMLVAFLAGIGLMCLKFVGYWFTGSSAILSDALESIINVVASGFGLGSIVLSAKPADESHPYGHGKIEFFSAGFEGALIIAAAIGIFLEGMKQILNPQVLPNLEKGLVFLAITGLGNLVLGLTLLRIGKRTKSIVLRADGKHLLTDVYTTSAVILGVSLVYITEWFRLDGIVACLAGINIVFWGSQLVREAFGGLMHRTDLLLIDEICDLLSRHKKEIWIDVHRLRAWRSGKRVHIDFHLILPKELPLEDAHREVKELERIFDAHFEGMSDLLVHLDPCLEPECSVCWLSGCGTRKDNKISPQEWSRETLTGRSYDHD